MIKTIRIFATQQLDEYQQIEFSAAVLARLCAVVNPEVDEAETFEYIHEALKEAELGLHNVDTLGRIVRTTIFDPKIHKMN